MSTEDGSSSYRQRQPVPFNVIKSSEEGRDRVLFEGMWRWKKRRAVQRGVLTAHDVVCPDWVGMGQGALRAQWGWRAYLVHGAGFLALLFTRDTWLFPPSQAASLLAMHLGDPVRLVAT